MRIAPSDKPREPSSFIERVDKLPCLDFMQGVDTIRLDWREIQQQPGICQLHRQGWLFPGSTACHAIGESCGLFQLPVPGGVEYTFEVPGMRVDTDSYAMEIMPARQDNSHHRIEDINHKESQQNSSATSPFRNPQQTHSSNRRSDIDEKQLCPQRKKSTALKKKDNRPSYSVFI